MQIELWQFVASTMGAWGALAGAFAGGFTVGRSRGKTEAYADMAKDRKRKKQKHAKDRPASTLSDEQGGVGTTVTPERERGTQP